jgi:hypothetical protein
VHESHGVHQRAARGGIVSAYRRQSVSATSTRCSKSLSNFDRARHGPEGRRGLPHHPQNKSSVLVLNSSTVDGTVMGLTLSGEPTRGAPEPHPYLVHQRTPGPVPRPRPIPSVTSVTSVRCFSLACVLAQVPRCPPTSFLTQQAGISLPVCAS